MGKVAYIDESMREDPTSGVYVMAAAIVGANDVDEVERDLRTAVGRRRHRFHWHNESEKLRGAFLDAVACEAIAGMAVAVAAPTVRRQEKARETALWNLVPRLLASGASELLFESRHEKQNRRDGRTLGSMQRCGIATGVSYRFGRPGEHALLWVADAFAGAAIASVGGIGSYVSRLPADKLVIVRLDA